MISIYFYWKKTLSVHKFRKCGPNSYLKCKQDNTSHFYTCIEIQALMIFSPNCWEKVFFFYSAYLQLQTSLNVFNNLSNKKLMTFNIIDDSQMTAFYVDKLIYRYLILCLLSFNSGHTNIAIWSVWECTLEHLLLHEMLNVYLLQILSGLLRCKSYQRNLSYLNCQNHFFLKRFKVQFR